MSILRVSQYGNSAICLLRIIAALARSANTHFVSGAGVVATLSGLISDPSVSGAIVGFVPTSYAATVSHVLVALGAVGMYLGKPKTIPASPVTFEGVSVMSQPAFIAKAEAAALDKVIALAEDPANKAAVMEFAAKEVAAGGTAVVSLADTVVDGLAKKNMLVRMFSGEAKAEVVAAETALVAMAGSEEELLYAKVLMELHALRAGVPA